MPIHRTIALRCRDVAAALLAGLWIGRDNDAVVAGIEALPPRSQAAFTLVTLALLMAVSLFAAQFGLIGLALFWLAIILIVA